MPRWSKPEIRLHDLHQDHTREAVASLTDPAFTQRYWGVTFESAWEVGSTMTFEQDGVKIVDPEQVVLESKPGRRLAYRWHTFTPEWAEVHGFSDEFLAEVANRAGAPRSPSTSSPSVRWSS